MIADVSVVGMRGQITIPKSIREAVGIFCKDSLLIKYDNNVVYLEKLESKKQKDELLKEFYIKYAKLNEEITNDFGSLLADV